MAGDATRPPVPPTWIFDIVTRRRVALPALLLWSAAACAAPAEADARARTAGVESFHALAGNGAPAGQGPEAWARWLDRRWTSDAGDAPAYRVSRLACPDGRCEVVEAAVVESCRALFDADLRHLEADREARASYQDWRLTCYAGRAIAQAAADARLVEFGMGAGGYRQLPAALGFPSGPAQVAGILETQAAHGDLGGFIDRLLSGVTVVADADATPWRVSVTDDEGWTRSWTWLARADINHDGRADLLVAASLRDTRTDALYAHRLFVVERSAADAPLSVAQEIPLVPGPVACDPYVARCDRQVVRSRPDASAVRPAVGE